MTEARTTAVPRHHLVTILVASSIVGVLLGLAITATEQIPGLPEPGAVVRVGIPITRVLLDMAAVLTVGLCLLPLLIGFDRPKLAEPVLAVSRRLAVATSLVWTVCALVALVLQTAEMRPGRDVSLGSIGEYVSAFGSGKALLFVAVFALISCGLSVVAIRIGEKLPAELRVAVALFALLPLPVTGHATNWRWHDFTMISMELHVMGAATWTGGLAVLLALAAANRGLLAHALPRFSKLATVCLVVVAASGLFNGLAEVLVTPGKDLFDGLFGTDYGVLVVAKILCVAAIALLGAKIRWRLLPSIARHGRTALVGWAALEIAVMGLAFGFAVVLTRAPVA
ncbi:putative copper resistance protein D [Herbihabitans rhizosphaerae]|uniref:Putative copper resistance protein D n=1 Tax=Herbihabitans rhizosphaerae TaxID=1872711 RepID=A0A4Q7KLK4_9PSEU|nr:CopD family protein [Herbihabitans rhizosphaerae]RZS37519.1 putative copper resistance protein D [Herbihabitans rhizosphaerae]